MKQKNNQNIEYHWLGYSTADHVRCARHEYSDSREPKSHETNSLMFVCLAIGTLLQIFYSLFWKTAIITSEIVWHHTIVFKTLKTNKHGNLMRLKLLTADDFLGQYCHKILLYETPMAIIDGKWQFYDEFVIWNKYITLYICNSQPNCPVIVETSHHSRQP